MARKAIFECLIIVVVTVACVSACQWWTHSATPELKPTDADDVDSDGPHGDHGRGDVAP